MLASSALGPVTFGLVATAFGGRADGLALRDAFFVMLMPLAAGWLVLLAAVRPYADDAFAAGHEQACWTGDQRRRHDRLHRRSLLG